MRSTSLLVAGLAVASIVVAACGSGSAAPSSSAQPANLPAPTPNPEAASLTDGTWDLVTFSPDASITIGGDLNPTINFAADGTYSGRAACNNYSGPYTLQGDALTMELGPMTMMACPTDVQTKFETAYLETLSKVRAFAIDLVDGKNVLTMGDESGKTLLKYTLGATGITGVEWTATGINNGKQAVVSTVADATVTMTLADDGQVSGNASCNTYNGSYTMDGSNITFGPLMSTKMACTPEEVNTQEQQYLAALANTKTWELMNGILTFRDADGATQVTYITK
jgi:heat shock protein HslJ